MNRKNEVFISYKRGNSSFAEKLVQVLREAGIDPWIDQSDIPKATEWWIQIKKGIVRANAVIFIISRESLQSEVCHSELAYAREYNKKLIPILYDERKLFDDRKLLEEIAGQVRPNPDGANVSWSENLAWIKKTNYIYATDHNIPSDEIASAIRDDIPYINEHTRLAERAYEWEKRDRKFRYLLRSGDLAEARVWLTASKGKEPQPSLLHQEYIHASLRAEKIQRRAVIAFLVSVAIVVSMLLVLFQRAEIRRDHEATQRAAAEATAYHESLVAESQRLAAAASVELDEQTGNPETAALLAISALKIYYTPQADGALRSALSHLYTQQIFTGLSDNLDNVAFSPDGRYLLLLGQEGDVQLWDASTGALVHTLEAGVYDPSSIVFSPDGNYILMGGFRSAQLWAVETGNLVQTFEGQTGILETVAYSPDGHHIFTGSEDGTAWLWEVETGVPVQELNGTAYNPWVAVFSPDGDGLLITQDNTARLWNVETGALISVFEGHTSSINSMMFSPDGRYILTGSSDNTARLWDINRAESLHTFEGHTGGIWRVAFSPDGTYALTGSWDNTARLWDVETGALIHIFEGHIDWIWSIAFSPDGRYMVTASDDNTARVWNIETGLLVYTFIGHNDKVRAVAYSPDGSYILTGSFDATARLWKLGLSEPIQNLVPDSEYGVTSVAFSPDGHYALTGGLDGNVHLWDVKSNEALHTFESHVFGYGTQVAFSPDGRFILTCGLEGMRLWNAETYKLLSTFNEQVSSSNVAFSPDGRYLIMGLGGPASSYGSVQLWDIESGELLYVFEGHKEGVVSVAFSPDGHYILSGSHDTSTRLWDVGKRELVRTFDEPTSTVSSVAFSPDGRYILIGSDLTTSLWEVESGKLIYTLEGHTDTVTSVAFSPDGHYILTGSLDTTARLWDVQTGTSVYTFESRAGRVSSLAFSPDGRFALIGNMIAQLRFVGTPKELVEYTCSHIFRNFSEDERLNYGIVATTPTCPQFAN